MNRLNLLYRALPQSTRRVFWIVTVIAVVLTLFGIALFRTLLLSDSALDLVGVSIPYALAIIAIISAISLLYNRVQFGTWLFFLSTLAAMLVVPFIQEGVAFPAAVLAMIVTVLIPLQATDGRHAALITGSGFVVAGLIIAIDMFWTGARANLAPRDEPITQAATIALGLILFIAILILYPSFNLRAKLLVISLGASLLSVIAVAGASTFYTQQALSQNTREKLLTASRHTADLIDTYITFNTEIIETEASQPIFSRYLSASSSAGQPSLADVKRAMQNLASRDTENIRSYALLDKNGSTVWDTRTVGLALSLGKDQAQQDFFRIPYESGRPYVSPVRFIPGGTGNIFYIGAPVRDANTGAVLGVLRIEIRALLLHDILVEASNAANDGSYAILLDEYNLVLADPLNPQSVSRAVSSLTQEQIDFLVKQNRLPVALPISEISLNMLQLANGLNNINETPFFESNDAAFGGAVYGAGMYLSSQPWKVAFLQPESIALAPVREQTRAITSAALVVSFVLGIATLFISRAFSGPIVRLTKTAEAISAGNLEARADVHSQDEVGVLASTLNEMSDQLKQTLAGLETTIAERTADLEQRGQELIQRSTELELANQRSERRAALLLAVSTVSNAIATVQNLNELLPLITRAISEKFGFYHIGIFLNDSSNMFAVLRAANSEGGQRMLQRGHRLKIGETGIVGNVVAVGRPRIALDTGTDAVFFNNPDLPDTRSEMALPLRAGPVVIGALDAQSTEPNAFAEEDVEILSTLAGQVSTAIRNATLFEEIQRSSAELQTILQQDVRRQWQVATDALPRAGYYYDGTALAALEKPAPKSADTILIPISVRGQTIGSLGIRPPTHRPLNEDELEIIRAVSERLAIAAENARLLEDSQKRAAKEQMIGDISAKIGASINLENILQIAVQELGQSLTGSQVSIRLKGSPQTGKNA